MTTDGEYLYFINYNNQGGMYKIGTGRGSTLPGKVYKYRPIGSSTEHVSWVCVNGNLFLSHSGIKLGTLKVYSSDTLEKKGKMALNFEGFDTQSPENLKANKGLKLATDGH